MNHAPLTVESAATADLATLAALYRQLTETPVDRARGEGVLARMLVDPTYRLLVCKDGGRVVGTAMGVIVQDLTGDCTPFILIENVVVDEQCRSRGAGQQLIRALEGWGREQGCHGVLLVSGLARKKAHHFYERLGYHFDGKGYRKAF